MGFWKSGGVLIEGNCQFTAQGHGNFVEKFQTGIVVSRFEAGNSALFGIYFFGKLGLRIAFFESVFN